MLRRKKSRRNLSAGRGSQTCEHLEVRRVLSATGMLAEDAVVHRGQSQSADGSQEEIVTAQQSPAQARIVNGTITTDYPAVGNVNDGCTGTLISPTHVLTAAHCLEGVADRGAAFTINGQTYSTVRITIHSQYNPAQFDLGYDIAIMELDRPVSGVEPMQILREAPQVGQMLTLVGLGQGGTTGNPSFDFGTLRVGETPIDQITQNHIIWNFDAGESNTAPGDSGGPAFVTINGVQYIAGVTSGGDGDAHTLGDRSFDTRVDTLATWIDQVLGNNSPDPGPTPDPIPAPQPQPIPIPDPDPGLPEDPGGELTAEDLARNELANYDHDGNNALDADELRDSLEDAGLSPSEALQTADDLIFTFDENGDGQLALPELIASWGGDPGIGDPGFGDPGFGDPGFGDPGFGDPGIGDPGIGDPGIGDPGIGDPGIGDPGFGDPGIGDPGFGDPGFGDVWWEDSPGWEHGESDWGFSSVDALFCSWGQEDWWF